MFCPKCSQQQLSDEVRFCSRCGFALEGVAMLLASGGSLPSSVAQGCAARALSPRRKVVRQGGQLMLLGLFLMPFFAVLHEITSTGGKLVQVGVLVLLVGLARLASALFYEGAAARPELTGVATEHAPHAAPQFGTQTRAGGELSSPRVVPAVSAYVPPRVETAELSYRPSVTEGTTRLLENQEDAPLR